MKYMRIELDRILQEGPGTDLYIFTFRPDLTELAASIEKIGLLTAPVLQEAEDGACRVVCGSLRIKALRRLGRKSVDAFVVANGEWTDSDCLSRSILENRWHRGFNEVEKALLFTRLRDRFHNHLPGLADALGNDLRVPQGPEALAPYRFLLSLPETILQNIARNRVVLAQALLLKGFREEARPGFCRIMTECGLTVQESRKAAEWIREIAGREGRGTADLVQDEEVLRIINENADPRQKARRLFAVLTRRRHPLLESWRARFLSARSQISAQDRGIQVSHDPTFETTQIKVQIQATSEPEFSRRLAALSEAARQGKIERLFRALSVE